MIDFKQIIICNMTAKTVDLQEWKSFGGGGFGESFFNKTDDSVILKLNKTSVSAEKALQEFQRSKAVFDMGIPSAEPYEFVTDGERYGMIVQRIQGKESFGRIIADHPERLEELAAITTAFLAIRKSLTARTCAHVSSLLPAKSSRPMSRQNFLPMSMSWNPLPPACMETSIPAISLRPTVRCIGLTWVILDMETR